MIHSVFYIKFELFLLFFICYIIFLHLCVKLSKLKLNFLDYIYVSALFFYLLLRCSLEDFDCDSTIYLFNNHIIFNNLIQLLKICMTLFFVVYLVLIYNFNNIIKLPIVEYLVLILSCFFSLIMIIISNHLFVIFLFLEVVNVCLYCLIGLNKNSNKGIEAAFKYFVQSSVATIIGFFAISLIYLYTGTLFLNELTILCANSPNFGILFDISLCILLFVIFFKLGLFPLHSWIPDVYQGSYLIVTLFIATLPKIAYIYLFIKIFAILPDILANYSLFIALLSILYGATVALYQTSFKRLLAYGSMVHMGFILYSLSLNTITGIASSIFYLLVYISLMVFVFSFMFFFFEKNESNSENNDNSDNIHFLDDISRLYATLNKNYLLSLYFAFIIISLAGLPFFVGFISKWHIFAGISFKAQFIELVVLIGSSVLSAAYYIRLIRFLFFIESKDIKVKFYTAIKLNKLFYVLIAFLFIFNILIIFYHNWLYLYILKCLLNLFK